MKENCTLVSITHIFLLFRTTNHQAHNYNKDSLTVIENYKLFKKNRANFNNLAENNASNEVLNKR